MAEIYLLVDYKGFFGSKAYSKPYRSGLNLALLSKAFLNLGYQLTILNFSEINLRNINFKNKYVLYTSSEDYNLLYKNYIEDIVYAVSLQGAILIPEYKYLKAHNNKVFMELLRDLILDEKMKNIKSEHYGTFEELLKNLNNLTEPKVVKSAEGAMSRNVAIAINKNDLLKNCKRFSKSNHGVYDIKDMLRHIKHTGYVKNSRNRKKFIVQNFIPNLTNDWKILVYGKKYYALYRGNRNKDFRASGSGKFIFKEDIPYGILNFAEEIYNHLNVPNLSIDVAFDGKEYYLFEFQALYFGSTTIEKSPFYFMKENSNWIVHKESSILEEEYSSSIIYYLKKKKLTKK